MKLKVFIIGCIEADWRKVNVVGRMSSPKAIHDACDTSDHSSDLNCLMNGLHLECALERCGGQKYKCDCNVYK